MTDDWLDFGGTLPNAWRNSFVGQQLTHGGKARNCSNLTFSLNILRAFSGVRFGGMELIPHSYANNALQAYIHGI